MSRESRHWYLKHLEVLRALIEKLSYLLTIFAINSLSKDLLDGL